MKIGIIGGSGFVGTRLIENLSSHEDISVLNLDKKQSDKYPKLTRIVNVLDLESLKRELKGVETVVLLAAEHRDDVTPTSLYYEVNVQGMRNTLEAMKIQGISRLVFTSTVAIYGLNKNNPNESFEADPFNHYGKSKWQAELVLQDWYKDHPHWNINIVRPTVIFGEGNRGNVYNLLKQIASDKFVMIGKGNNEKSMSYVGNVVAFIKFLIIEKKKGYNYYNYVDKPDFTTKSFVEHTCKVLDKKTPAFHIPYWLGLIGGYGFDLIAFITRKKLSISSIRIKKFCAVTKYDATKAMSSGFVPPYALKHGLRNVLREEFGNGKYEDRRK